MTGYRFPRAVRLLTPGDFQGVFGNAELKVSCPELLLLARRNGRGHPRLGLVIARKNIRHAVARNRVRRIVRENFRMRQRDLADLDIVVMVRKGADQLDNPELHRHVQQLLRQLQRRYQRLEAATS